MRSALVRGHDEVRIIRIVANDRWRMLDAAADTVVGYVEQSRDELPVPVPKLTLHRARDSAFEDEATLRADRHDDGVLEHLCLHQTEDFRAEIVGAIAPADAAAGDAPSAQVNPLEPR